MSAHSTSAHTAPPHDLASALTPQERANPQPESVVHPDGFAGAGYLVTFREALGIGFFCGFVTAAGIGITVFACLGAAQ